MPAPEGVSAAVRDGTAFRPLSRSLRGVSAKRLPPWGRPGTPSIDDERRPFPSSLTPPFF